MKEFAKYAIASGIAFVADFLTLLLLTELFHLHYLISASIGFVLGASIVYLISIAWAFEHRALEKQHHEYVVFVLIGILGLLVNNAAMWVFTEQLSTHYLLSKALATGGVFFFNFVARRKLLFTAKISSPH